MARPADKRLDESLMARHQSLRNILIAGRQHHMHRRIAQAAMAARMTTIESNGLVAAAPA